MAKVVLSTLPLILLASCAQLTAGVGENNLDIESLETDCKSTIEQFDATVAGTIAQDVNLNDSMGDLVSRLLVGNTTVLDDGDSTEEDCVKYVSDVGVGELCSVANKQTRFDIVVFVNGLEVEFSATTSNRVEFMTIYDSDGLLYRVSGDPERQNELTGCRYFERNCSDHCADGEDCEHVISIGSGHTEVSSSQQCFEGEEPFFS